MEECAAPYRYVAMGLHWRFVLQHARLPLDGAVAA